MWYDHAYEEAKGHISENVKRSVFGKTRGHYGSLRMRDRLFTNEETYVNRKIMCNKKTCGDTGGLPSGDGGRQSSGPATQTERAAAG